MYIVSQILSQIFHTEVYIAITLESFVFWAVVAVTMYSVWNDDQPTNKLLMEHIDKYGQNAEQYFQTILEHVKN